MTIEPEWNINEMQSDCQMLGLRKDKDYIALEKKCEQLHDLLNEQWQQNYSIKNKNLELEDTIKVLKEKLERATKKSKVSC